MAHGSSMTNSQWSFLAGAQSGNEPRNFPERKLPAGWRFSDTKVAGVHPGGGHQLELRGQEHAGAGGARGHSVLRGQEFSGPWMLAGYGIAKRRKR